MQGKKLLPSILNADFWQLGELIKATLQGGADGLHMDIMDGHFVPNLTFGPYVVAHITEHLKKEGLYSREILIDSHLMIENPSEFIGNFIKAGSNAISVHWETEKHLHRTISHIKEKGSLAGVVINPATPVEFLNEILPFIDFVLIMSVNPGFGGQTFIKTTLKKIEKLAQLRKNLGLSFAIEVDGGIKLSNVKDVLKAGADWLVVGSAIFSSSNPQEIEDNTKRFKEILNCFS
jgi:ribulose-phosphate 3-epimerase